MSETAPGGQSEADALPPLPGRAARALGSVSAALSVLGAAGTLAIMALINADVGGRYLFSAPVPATAEIVAAGIVSIVFLQLSHAIRQGRSIRSDMLISRLRARSPRAADGLDAFHHLVGAAMLAVLVRYIWPEVRDAMVDFEVVGLYGMFTLPAWPFSLAVLAGAVMAGVQYLLLALAYLRAAVRGRRA